MIDLTPHYHVEDSPSAQARAIRAKAQIRLLGPYDIAQYIRGSTSAAELTAKFVEVFEVDGHEFLLLSPEELISLSNHCTEVHDLLSCLQRGGVLPSDWRVSPQLPELSLPGPLVIPAILKDSQDPALDIHITTLLEAEDDAKEDSDVENEDDASSSSSLSTTESDSESERDLHSEQSPTTTLLPFETLDLKLHEHDTREEALDQETVNQERYASPSSESSPPLPKSPVELRDTQVDHLNSTTSAHPDTSADIPFEAESNTKSDTFPDLLSMTSAPPSPVLPRYSTFNGSLDVMPQLLLPIPALEDDEEWDKVETPTDMPMEESVLPGGCHWSSSVAPPSVIAIKEVEPTTPLPPRQKLSLHVPEFSLENQLSPLFSPGAHPDGAENYEGWKRRTSHYVLDSGFAENVSLFDSKERSYVELAVQTDESESSEAEEEKTNIHVITEEPEESAPVNLEGVKMTEGETSETALTEKEKHDESISPPETPSSDPTNSKKAEVGEQDASTSLFGGIWSAFWTTETDVSKLKLTPLEPTPPKVAPPRLTIPEKTSSGNTPRTLHYDSAFLAHGHQQRWWQ